MTNENETRIYLNEVCERFGVHIRTVHSWIRRKRNPLKAWKIGGRVHTTEAALEEFKEPVVKPLVDSQGKPEKPFITKNDIRRRDEALARIRRKFGKA